MPRLIRLPALVLLAILLAGTMAAYAATNTVPSTRLDLETIAINANALKPSACAALNLTNIASGSGTVDGTNANDLILGSAGADTMRGRQGTDCLMGGDGDDDLRGDQDGDILLGGDGNDSFNGGPGTDICDGQGGTDTGHPTCETELNIP